jgi:hypothetical protein
MIIRRADMPHHHTFKDLRVGDIFTWDEGTFIKLPRALVGGEFEPVMEVTAFDLEENEYALVDEDEPVQLLYAEMVIHV